MIPPEAKESMDKNKMGLKGTVEEEAVVLPGILFGVQSIKSKELLL